MSNEIQNGPHVSASSADTSSADFFEVMYQRDPDPWRFAESGYELSRYARVIAVLSGQRYARAFEPGCSIGVLTAQLAKLCDRVEAVDLAPTAAAEARKRCTALPNVHVSCGALDRQLPAELYDLLVFSEIGYYFEPTVWQDVCAQVVGRMQSGATLLAVHWLGASKDHRMSGDQVHEILRLQTGLRLTHEERHEGFRLDRWVRT